ncbi:hypothetical protein MJG53_011659 [Ovis ammon polii x Ovis aries]|uniref:Uncharacterized protein n=1 Tax=Ovis ammon polii x Ovis aries TaxID=2918886 RepID=A0ACB9UPA9_9CETA|nr:hypothetical protein MJG53_011659 [Ovis ammon polii x Ovis aries]
MEVLPGEEEEAEELEGVGLVALWGDDISGCDLQAMAAPAECSPGGPVSGQSKEQFPNKTVAQVACDVLQLLVSYWEKLQMFETSLPRKIAEAVQITKVTPGLCHLPPGAGPLAGCGGKAILDLLPWGSQDGTVVCLIGNLSSLQILVATIAFLLPSAEYSSVETDKKFLVSLLLCLLDWCMALPAGTLLHPVSTAALDEQPPARAPLLDYIYRVLHCCICGSSTYNQQSRYTLTLADLSSSDYDPFLPLANVKNSEPVQFHSSAELGNLLTVEEGQPWAVDAGEVCQGETVLIPQIFSFLTFRYQRYLGGPGSSQTFLVSVEACASVSSECNVLHYGLLSPQLGAALL